MDDLQAERSLHLLAMAKKVCVAARAFSFSPNATAARGSDGLSSAVNLLSDSTRLSITCQQTRADAYVCAVACSRKSQTGPSGLVLI